MSPQMFRLYLHLSYSFTKYNRALRFGLFQPTSHSYNWSLLASCKYFNLPYFQPAYIKYLSISTNADIQLSLVVELISHIVRYFVASIIRILNLDYLISGVTLCPYRVTTLGWQLRPSRHLQKVSVYQNDRSSPQLGEFVQYIAILCLIIV